MAMSGESNDRIESCHDCGIEQPLIWTAPDGLWVKVTGITDGSGVFCPRCFNKRAGANVGLLRWVPELIDAWRKAPDASVGAGAAQERMRAERYRAALKRVSAYWGDVAGSGSPDSDRFQSMPATVRAALAEDERGG